LRTIAVLNQKGGVGKTTSAVNTAAAIAAAGRKVVVIDFDPQAHMTIHLGVEPQAVQIGAYEVLTESAGFESSLMLVRPNLWLLAANINLVGAETELVNVVGREIILREAMQVCRDKFDFCLIDCAPSLGLLSLNALAAAEEVLIPLQPHFLALQGFGKLLQTVDLVNKRINPRLKVTGVLLCMHDTRTSLSNEVHSDIERFLSNARGTNSAWDGAVVLPSFIRRNIKLAEAPSYGQTIFEYDPTCNGAEDYRKVGNFFLGISDEPEQPPEPVESQPQAEIQPEIEPQQPSGPMESQPQVQASPALVPIEIREINLPAPQCYTPVPIYTEPPAPAPKPMPAEPIPDIPSEAV
jgi:chromosome partitioning protein